MSISSKLKLFLGFLFLVAICNSLLTFQLDSHGEEKLKWVNHTHEVILSVNKLLSEMTDAETGQRGYLLTKDDSYLTPYFLGLASSKEEFDHLKKLTSDNDIQQKRLAQIGKLMKLKFAELSETIKLKQDHNGGIDKALARVKNNKGKRYMNDIRNILQKINQTEAILLENRKGNYRAHKASIVTLIIVEIMFFIFLAFMTVSFLNKNLFTPMKLLLDSTHKMENGIKVEIADIIPKDEMGYLLSSFFKMHEQVHNREEVLTYSANHDELTGLFNRTKMYDEIQTAIDNVQKSKTKCAVLFLDLNKFKQLNDKLGHDAGDLMLKEVSERLEKSVRNENNVFRIGGDEFLVLIKDIDNAAIVEKIVLNILKIMQAPVTIQGQAVDISLSIGIAIAPDDATNNDELIKYADIAMYVSKNDEDTDYTFFDKSMLKRSDDR